MYTFCKIPRTGLGNSKDAVSTAAWEYVLADGVYEITVGVGDPDFFDTLFSLFSTENISDRY